MGEACISRVVSWTMDLGLAVDEDFTRIRRLEPNQVFEQDTFAAATGSHDHEDFAGS